MIQCTDDSNREPDKVLEKYDIRDDAKAVTSFNTIVTIVTIPQHTHTHAHPHAHTDTHTYIHRERES